jgi:hypothetical protein
MEKQVHKIANRCIVNGAWTRDSYDVVIDGESYDFRDLAKQHGIEMGPKSKKQINTDVEEKHEDMERSHDSRDTEVDGDGDSEGTE